MHHLYPCARDARKLIELPSHWTVGVAARDVHGEEVPACYPAAVAFCSIGTLDRAADDHGESSGVLFNAFQSIALGRCEYIASWNDASTHEQVLAGFDKFVTHLALCPDSP